MLCHDGKLFVRHNSSDREKPFIVIDTNTLEKIEDFEIKIKDPNDDEKSEDEGEKDERAKPITMLRDEKADKKTGRILGNGPFVTDGFMFYVISLKKDMSNDSDEEEDKQPTRMVVECFDPSTPEFNFVKSVTLYKNAQKDPFVKQDNSDEVMNDYYCATNGRYFFLMMNNMKTYIFDLDTGIQVSKSSPTETTTSGFCYNPQKGTFYSFKSEDKYASCTLFINKAFEPAVQSTIVKEVQGGEDTPQMVKAVTSSSGTRSAFGQVCDSYLNTRVEQP
jgi:hypothetical protein